ncbi:MAG: T9SS type A sorting domain-containing protein [Flavobacterium sp.]
MRKNYLLPTLLVPLSAMCQFGSPQFIDTAGSANSIKQFIKTADVDGNGTKDIIVGNDINSEIRVCTNNGNLSFSAAANVASTWNKLASMDVADFDNDGKPDIVVVENVSQTLSWHKNINGVFQQKTLIQSGLTFVMGRVLTHDFDSDGDTDILLLNHNNVLLFLNTGTGNFTVGQNVILPDDETEFYDIILGDFNNDSFKDFAIATGGFEIYLNNGQAQFTRVHGVSDSVTMLMGVGDFNNDNVDDVTIKTSVIKSCKNSGTTTFTSATITATNQGAKSFHCADLDKDGFDDILTQDNQLGTVLWYKSTGDGTFAAGQNIYANAGGVIPTAVYADDLDSDGDDEIIWTAGNGVVAVHSNQAVLSTEKHSHTDASLYPNPARDLLFVSASAPLQSVTIYNMLGQKVLSASAQEINAGAIWVYALQEGSYLVQLNDGKGVSNLKFIKS